MNRGIILFLNSFLFRIYGCAGHFSETAGTYRD